MFDEFDVETNDYQEPTRRVSSSKAQNVGTFPGTQQNNIPAQNNQSLSSKLESQEKINNIKAILSAYIKEKELDM